MRSCTSGFFFFIRSLQILAYLSGRHTSLAPTSHALRLEAWPSAAQQQGRQGLRPARDWPALPAAGCGARSEKRSASSRKGSQQRAPAHPQAGLEAQDRVHMRELRALTLANTGTGTGRRVARGASTGGGCRAEQFPAETCDEHSFPASKRTVLAAGTLDTQGGTDVPAYCGEMSPSDADLHTGPGTGRELSRHPHSGGSETPPRVLPGAGLSHLHSGEPSAPRWLVWDVTKHPQSRSTVPARPLTTICCSTVFLRLLPSPWVDNFCSTHSFKTDDSLI